MTPVTREEVFLNAVATGETSGLPTPITREEVFYNAIANGTTEGLPTPATREEVFLNAIAQSGGGGSITVEPLSVTENGTYTAEEGTAYSPVTVNVSGAPVMTRAAWDALTVAAKQQYEESFIMVQISV